MLGAARGEIAAQKPVVGTHTHVLDAGFLHFLGRRFAQGLARAKLGVRGRDPGECADLRQDVMQGAMGQHAPTMSSTLSALRLRKDL